MIVQLNTQKQMSVNELRTCLTRLEQQAQALRDQGAIPHPEFRLDCSKNVPSGGKIYYRKRYKAGAIGQSGKRSEAISEDTYRQLQQQLQLGRKLRQIEAQIHLLTQQVDRHATAVQPQFRTGSKVRFWLMQFGRRTEYQGIVVSRQSEQIQVAVALSNGLNTIVISPTQLLEPQPN